MAEKHDLIGYLSSLHSIADTYDKTGFGRPVLLDDEARLTAARLMEILQGEADERKKNET